MNTWSTATYNTITFQQRVPGSSTPYILITGVNGGGGLTDLGAPSAGHSNGRMIGSAPCSGAPYSPSDNNAEHELGHALGFYHVWQRPDRNRYVQFRTQYETWDNTNNVHAGSLCPASELDGSGYGDSSNAFRCLPDSPPAVAQMIGPFSFHSVMETASHEILAAANPTAVDTYGVMGRVEGVDSGFHVQPEDADAVLQMYAKASGFGVFRPLDRASSVSNGVLRDYSVAPGIKYRSFAGNAPAMDSWGVGHIDVYIRGTDNKLYQKYNPTAGTYSDWLLLDTNIASNPSAVSWGWARSDIAAISTTGNVVVKSYSSGWQPWTNIGKPSVGVASGSSPAISSRYPGSLDVFVRGSDNRLYISTCADSTSCLTPAGFSSWHAVPGTATFLGNPAAISRVPGYIDIFVHGNDDFTWQVEYTGTWGSWTRVEGGTAISGSSPAVASTSGAPLDVYIVGADSRVWRNWWNGLTWSGYRPIGGTIAAGGSLAAVGKTSGSTTELHLAAPIQGVAVTGAPAEGVGIWLRSWPDTAW